ncbi:MAG: murein hydrolase activator EnvC [Vulcanibacillus sp.]
MSKRKSLYILIIFALVFSFLVPPFEVSAESEWDKLDREIQELQKQKEEAARASNALKQEISKVQTDKKTIEKDLVKINAEIKEAENKLFALEKELADVTNQAKAAADELEEAVKRVDERDALLKSRVRLMYKNGSVDYIEVLLSSTSFTDFLQRFSALKKIVESDKNILTANINDKNIIEEKKNEIDTYLVSLEELFTETEELKASLRVSEEKRMFEMASLDDKEEQLKEANLEEERIISELALAQSKKINEKSLLEFAGGKFTWPVPESRRITSDYGLRIDPFTGARVGHTGIDIGHAPNKSSLYGADIVAAADGVVIVASYVNGYGNTVMIDHGSGLWTLYAHIRNGGIKVKVGEAVVKGEKIAEVGTTGRSTGPHLHFEVRLNNVPVNPWNYLK